MLKDIRLANKKKKEKEKGNPFHVVRMDKGSVIKQKYDQISKKGSNFEV